MYMHCTRNYYYYYYFYYTMIINYNVCIYVCKESKINYLNLNLIFLGNNNIVFIALEECDKC